MDRNEAISALRTHVENYAETSGKMLGAVLEEAGIPSSTYYRKSRGHGDFSVFEAKALADLIGISVDELIS